MQSKPTAYTANNYYSPDKTPYQKYNPTHAYSNKNNPYQKQSFQDNYRGMDRTKTQFEDREISYKRSLTPTINRAQSPYRTNKSPPRPFDINKQKNVMNHPYYERTQSRDQIIRPSQLNYKNLYTNSRGPSRNFTTQSQHNMYERQPVQNYSQNNAYKNDYSSKIPASQIKNSEYLSMNSLKVQYEQLKKNSEFRDEYENKRYNLRKQIEDIFSKGKERIKIQNGYSPLYSNYNSRPNFVNNNQYYQQSQKYPPTNYANLNKASHTPSSSFQNNTYDVRSNERVSPLTNQSYKKHSISDLKNKQTTKYNTSSNKEQYPSHKKSFDYNLSKDHPQMYAEYQKKKYSNFSQSYTNPPHHQIFMKNEARTTNQKYRD